MPATTTENDSITNRRTRQVNGTLQLNPLPNPYPVPDKPFSIFFEERQETLSRGDVVGCIHQAYDVILDHLCQHGDSPLPRVPSSLDFQFGNVIFGIAPVTWLPPPFLTYNDTLAVLEAFSVKMSRDGYWSWFAEITLTEGGGHLGDALISEIEERSLQL